MFSRSKVVYLILVFISLNCWAIPSALHNDLKPYQQSIESYYDTAGHTIFYAARNQSKLLDFDRKSNLTSVELTSIGLTARCNFSQQLKGCVADSSLRPLGKSKSVLLFSSQLNV
jgi:hypothetical protein